MGLYFRREARNRALKYFSSLHFTEKQGHHDLVYRPWNWKISPPFREIEANFGKITMRVRRSRPLYQSKWSGAIFGPRSSKVNVQKVLLCPFQQRIKTSGFSLEIPALENIPQFPENRAEVHQNHDARKAVSATLWVLKWSGALFQIGRASCRERV